MKGEKISGCPKCEKGSGVLKQCPLKDWYKVCTSCGWSTPHFKSAGQASDWWTKATS